MRTAEIWKIYIYLFSESIFIIKSGWLINLSRYIGASENFAVSSEVQPFFPEKIIINNNNNDNNNNFLRIVFQINYINI